MDKPKARDDAVKMWSYATRHNCT